MTKLKKLKPTPNKVDVGALEPTEAEIALLAAMYPNKLLIGEADTTGISWTYKYLPIDVPAKLLVADNGTVERCLDKDYLDIESDNGLNKTWVLSFDGLDAVEKYDTTLDRDIDNNIRTIQHLVTGKIQSLRPNVQTTSNIKRSAVAIGVQNAVLDYLKGKDVAGMDRLHVSIAWYQTNDGALHPYPAEVVVAFDNFDIFADLTSMLDHYDATKDVYIVNTPLLGPNGVEVRPYIRKPKTNKKSV